jgi:hypothetical protein
MPHITTSPQAFWNSLRGEPVIVHCHTIHMAVALNALCERHIEQLGEQPVLPDSLLPMQQSSQVPSVEESCVLLGGRWKHNP